MTRNIDIARRQAALDQTCTKCHMPPGRRCRDQYGREMDVPHSVRYGAIPY